MTLLLPIWRIVDDRVAILLLLLRHLLRRLPEQRLMHNSRLAIRSSRVHLRLLLLLLVLLACMLLQLLLLQMMLLLLLLMMHLSLLLSLLHHSLLVLRT